MRDRVKSVVAIFAGIAILAPVAVHAEPQSRGKAAGNVACALLFGVTCSKWVDVSSRAYLRSGATLTGTLQVLPVDEEQANSLQFGSVADQLSTQLYEKGFSQPSAGAKPDFVAFATYGIDTGRTRFVSLPVYGQVGGGTTQFSGTSFGTGGTTSFSGTAYSMPSYGYVGTEASSQTTYRRRLNVDVYDVRKSPPEKVLEVRAESEGSCGNINSVISALAAGTIDALPASIGATKRVRENWSGKC